MISPSFSKAKPGEVFAVSLGSAEHGYVFVCRGRALGVFPVITTGLARSLAEIEAHNPRWFFNYLVQPHDQTKMIKIGEASTISAEKAWAPPRFIPPSIFKNFFRILESGQLRPATEAETAGLQKVQTVTPETLQVFIKEHANECLHLHGDTSPVQYAPPPSEEEPEGNVFMEVVFQAREFPFKARDIPEDALNEALRMANIGEVTGGGTGPHTSAIDVEVADFSKGLKVIKETLKKIGAPASTEIHRHRPTHIIYRLD